MRESPSSGICKGIIIMCFTDVNRLELGPRPHRQLEIVGKCTEFRPPILKGSSTPTKTQKVQFNSAHFNHRLESLNFGISSKG